MITSDGRVAQTSLARVCLHKDSSIENEVGLVDKRPSHFRALNWCLSVRMFASLLARAQPVIREAFGDQSSLAKITSGESI